MQPSNFPPLPTDTVDAAKSVFNIENLYITIGDQIEQLLTGIDLANLSSSGGVGTKTLSLLALVTIFQFAEKMPDRLAGEAVRTRTDWKYALHLPLIHPGIDPSALDEFRQQLLRDTTGKHVFQSMLDRISKVGLLSSRAKKWDDVPSFLMYVDTLTQLDWLAQAFSLALEALAAYQPELSRKMTLPHLHERYTQIPNIIQQTESMEGLDNLVNMVGKDTAYLLETIANSGNPEADQLQEIQDLKRKFNQFSDRRGNPVKR